MTTMTSPQVLSARQAPTRANRRPSFLSSLLVAARFNFLSVVREPILLVFSVGLPLFMYYIYGTGHSYVTQSVGHGNVSARILLSMVTYGCVISLSSLGANVALERSNGWVRQIAMTPIKLPGWIASKVIAGLGVAAVIVIVCFVAGGMAQAKMDPAVWVETGVAACLCAAMASPFGLAVAFLLKSETAFGIVGATTSVFAFASGMFTPLDQMGKTMQTIAQFMPYYGVNRIPVGILQGTSTLTWHDFASVIAWFVIFSGVAVFAARRKTER